MSSNVVKRASKGAAKNSHFLTIFLFASAVSGAAWLAKDFAPEAIKGTFLAPLFRLAAVALVCLVAYVIGNRTVASDEQVETVDEKEYERKFKDFEQELLKEEEERQQKEAKRQQILKEQARARKNTQKKKQK